jgi:hypothetical protein
MNDEGQCSPRKIMSPKDQFIGPYPEPDKSSSHCNISVIFTEILSSPLGLRISSGFFLFSYSIKIFYKFLI